MSRDVNAERLERLRGELAELRARTRREHGGPQDDTTPALGLDVVTDGDPVAGEGPQDAADEVSDPAAEPVVDRDEHERTDTPADRPDPDPEPYFVAARSGEPESAADGEAASGGRRRASAHRAPPPPREAPTGPLGRRKVPRPPRRNPLRRRRARRPPDRLAVPAPVPVPRRSPYLAAPRWPAVDLVAGLLIAVVMVPVGLQLAFRLWTAMNETSFLLGADPTRAESLQAAAGVAGGGITTAVAVAALAVVRGRPGYLAAAAAVVALFVVFPFMGYSAQAEITSAPVPDLAEMIAPAGWPRAGQLQATFWLVVVALLAAVGDLAQRSVAALREGWASRR